MTRTHYRIGQNGNHIHTLYTDRSIKNGNLEIETLVVVKFVSDRFPLHEFHGVLIIKWVDPHLLGMERKRFRGEYKNAVENCIHWHLQVKYMNNILNWWFSYLFKSDKRTIIHGIVGVGGIFSLVLEMLESFIQKPLILSFWQTQNGWKRRKISMIEVLG